MSSLSLTYNITSPWRACHLTVLLYRFDLRRAYKPSVMQKLKDVFGIGGHVYGYGSYFAAEAVYSHWWNKYWHKYVAVGAEVEV